MPHRVILAGGAVFMVLAARPAAAAPLQYLTGAGSKAVPVVWLTWGLLLISIAVIVIIAGLLAGAIWRRPGLAWTAGQKVALLPDQGGLHWLWIGTGISALALLISVVWTVKVLALIQAPKEHPAVTIEVTGRQWWWQLHYLLDDGRDFYTANEIHIPAGHAVRLKLRGGDVIHSFWVPQLAGKMDAIPGLVNETWIEASHPGIFLGQCTEYCGAQHAKMLLRVVAQSPPDFQAWSKRQLASPDMQVAGAEAFAARCGGCHSVRGTAATGSLGPDLSHLMMRQTLGAGILPNDPSTLARWIADPQGLKPGILMPKIDMPQAERAGIVSYLLALR
jgi:cytochrome c oxidase subunit 2